MTTVKMKFIRTAPRKIRLVLQSIKGMNIDRAIAITQFMAGQASKDVYLALNSAKASANDKGLNIDKLVVVEARCDEGPRIKRRIMHSKGRASAIAKCMSHIQITVGDKLASDKKES